MASIFSIVYQPLDREYEERQTDFIRVPVESARLLSQHGVEGDQKAGHHPDRQLNILSLEWLNSIEPQGYKTSPGQFGEQLIVTGLAVERLEPGARLQLGREAQIEITRLRTGCIRLEAAQEKSIQGIGPIGALARILVSGTIRVNDPVRILEGTEESALADLESA
jgi:MOSC domain-containing protein YiiM